MSRRLLSLTGCSALVLAMSAMAFAQNQPTQQQNSTQTNQQTTRQTTQQPTQQTTVTTQTTQTQAVQNADGSWTVIEYPVNREVTLDFTPGSTFTSATSRARIMRMGDHTMVNLDLSGLPSTVTSFNVYAVDPMGKATLLGPINITNGTATQQFMTPLNRFMLVLSPDANVTTYSPNTNFAFRSNVPQGFAVVPLSSRDREDGAAVGEKVSATTTAGATTPYTAPMLGISGMNRGEDVQMKINLTGALSGARANVDLLPRKDGPTTIKMRFHELKDAPAGHVYVVWAVSPDGKFVKLGQIVNTGGRNEAELRSETALPEFGLLITLENETSTPTGTIVGTVIR